MEIAEIENAARYAWPALEEQELPFGILRYSRGTDRRANSLSLFPNSEFETEGIISVTEQFFAARDAAPIVRILRPNGRRGDAFLDLDAVLDGRGYVKQSPTLSMLLDLSSIQATREDLPASVTAELDIESWLRAWYGICERDMERLRAHAMLFEKSDLAHRFLLKRDCDGAALCTGMAVYADRAIGLFGIATAAAQRERGYAKALVDTLLRWGQEKGAGFAYLQVEESNKPAVNLYRGLGFQTVYSYWYRVGKQTNLSGGE